MRNTISGASGVSGRAAIMGLALAVGLAVALAGLPAQPVAAEPAAAKTVYTLTELGTFGGATSIARGVDGSGNVVGQSQLRLPNGSQQTLAFFWEGGPIKEVGRLGGPTSSARAINDTGKVVGFSQDSSVNNQTRAFVADLDERSADGKTLKPQSLGTLSAFSSSEAWAVNDSGQVAGRSYSSSTNGRAFLWTDGQMENLGVFPGDTYSEAWAVNDSGQVVGESGRADGSGRAFLAERDADGDPKLRPLGTLPNQPFSEAMGINNSGQVVGWSYSSNANVRGEAFLYQEADDGTWVMEGLGALPEDLYSRARAIDESGRVVGQSRDASGQNRAFLWENGKMKDLNALTLIPAGSSLKLLDAYAINESGQIVGSANRDGQTVPFLLTPDTNEPKIECGTADDLWHKVDVTIPCTASDTGVGLADAADASFILSTSVPDGTETADAPTGTREVCDAAGNCAIAGPIRGNKVDKKAPEITITTSPSGDEYVLGESITVGYDCADAGSGVASCSGPAASGGNLDTASVGQKTFTVEASDEAGNAASESYLYRVVYDFGGFFSPVDNLPTLNTVNAGRAVPVKFSLSGDQGLDIFAAGYPASQRIDCDSRVPVDGIEETVAAGSSGLTYDPSTDRYNYVWKTARAWEGTCRQLTIKLDDGTLHQANFKLR